MFKLEVVRDCPVTRSSQGVLTFDKATVGMIAGAVRDNIEWIVLLNGKRSDDGFEVLVERITVPQQYRSGGHAEMTELDLAADVVGVMHSHHQMGAFFSGTDRNSLNPRFPTSIVVAIDRSNLGFEYQAEGKVKLPCGSLGVVPFKVSVADAGERFVQAVVRGRDDGGRLGGCNKWGGEAAEFTMAVQTECGLRREVDRPLVFGQEGDGLLKVIEEMTLKRQYSYYTASKGNGTGSTGGNTLSRKEKKRLRRNGLQKLERPGDTPSTFRQLADRNAKVGDRYSYKGGCDECELRGVRLKWNVELEAWLCFRCTEEVQAEMKRLEGGEAGIFDDSDLVHVDERGSFHLLGDGNSDEWDDEKVAVRINNGDGTVTEMRLEGDTYVRRLMWR